MQLEAGADPEQLGGRGPGWEGVRRGLRGGWVTASLTDVLVLVGEARPGYGTLPEGAGRSVATPCPGSPLPEAVLPPWAWGTAFPTAFPVLGQVFPWSGLFVLCTANENLKTFETVAFAGKYEFDPSLEKIPALN